MEFGRAFSFVFKDPDWIKKVAISGLIGLIPVLGQLYLLGWGLETTRRVIKGETELLPEIDFGGFLGKGFQAWVIALVYAIPVIILQLPLQLVGPLGASLQMDQDTLSYLMIGVSVCCGGLLLIYSIILAFMVPAALGNFVAKNQLGAGLRFGEVFALVKAAPVTYLLVIVGNLLVGFIAPLGLIACVIGVVVTQAYGLAVMGHFIGQAYREATHKLGAA